MNHIPKKIVNAAVLFGVFSLVTVGVGTLYNFVDSEINKYQERQIAKEVRAEEEYRRNITGAEILNVKSLVVGEVAEDGQVRTMFSRGENIPFTFCREPLTNVIAGVNVRSYYRTEGDTEVQSRQRTLPEGILYENVEDNCPVLTLFADNLPRENGRFSFCQTVQFTAWGYNKDVTYCSDNKFEIGE